ncbi:hypothetical protein ACIGO6_39700 [Streptomyces sp. NPDC053750]|uniref:hypothetical protein n=1 Tax=Streptomyces sp. NPDC053750 TaxID=3365714 RepID=UPI0037D61E4A
MTSSLSHPRTILEKTDWSRLEHGGGPAGSETPAILAGLESGDPAAVRAACSHLWDDLLHQGSLYSATPPSALYVAAVLERADCGDFLSESHLIALLEWLAEASYAVGDEKRKQLEDWYGPGVMDRDPLFGEMQSIRPTLFRGVIPWTFVESSGVAEAALLAALHLLDSLELQQHRAILSPNIRRMLAVSSRKSYRVAAVVAMAAWGEEIDSIEGAAELLEARDEPGSTA